MTAEHLLLEEEDGITTVTINRPRKLNALNQATIAELDRAFADLATRDDIGGVIVTGAGEKAFVAGAEIGELAELDAVSAVEVIRSGQATFRRIERLGKPTVAAIGGYALGAGCELALACTLRVAARHAKIGLPEVSLGIIPGYGGTQRLSRLIGRGRALEMILTGEPVTADEALAIGLVNQVVPAEELEDAARTLLRRILSRGPLAVRAAIEVVQTGLDGPLQAGQELEAALFARLCGSHDMHEGMTAFLDKRKPEFRGH